MEQNREIKEELKQVDEQKSFIMRKNIRSTVYEVEVHFSQSSKETLLDKIRRLIRNEVMQ